MFRPVVLLNLPGRVWVLIYMGYFLCAQPGRFSRTDGRHKAVFSVKTYSEPSRDDQEVGSRFSVSTISAYGKLQCLLTHAHAHKHPHYRDLCACVCRHIPRERCAPPPRTHLQVQEATRALFDSPVGPPLLQNHCKMKETFLSAVATLKPL